MSKLNKNQIELQNEVENKLNQAEEVYGYRKYYISLATEKETINKINKIKRLGYKVTKSEDIKNHYEINGKII